MSEPRLSAALRRAVAERARQRFEYCQLGDEFSASPFCVEHILPAVSGGPSTFKNLAFSCAGCNAHKSDKTSAFDPVTSEPAALFHPRRDAWERHFAWSVDGLLIVGLTPLGRATVVALKLNRDGLVNLRRILIAAQEHPPV
jgi:hypothetical protein